MRQDRRDRDPWEGYEFIDINSRGEKTPPAPQRAPSGLPGAPPPGGAGISPPEEPKKEPRQGAFPRDPAAGRLPNAGRRGEAAPQAHEGRAGLCWAFTLLAMAAVTALVCTSSCCSRCAQSRSPATRSTTLCHSGALRLPGRG